MSNTQIYKKIRQFIADNRPSFEALSLVALLSLSSATSDISRQQAHFSQQLIISTSSSASLVSAMTKEMAAKEEILVEPYLVEATEPLHAAATSEQSSTVKAEALSSSSSSTAIIASSKNAADLPTITLPKETVPSSISSNSSISSLSSTSSFPAFGHAVHPVNRVPNWGAMTTPAQWNRRYKELQDADFVSVPAYSMKQLLVPMDELTKTRSDPETIKTLTAKLYYSTRYFGAYDLDAGEFTAVHPGIDLKLAEGTPVGAVAGGRVSAVRRDDASLGIFVIIEHYAPDGLTYYSLYGHLGTSTVQAGDTVEPGQRIGLVGMTGHTSGPHLHLQIERGEPLEQTHQVYWPAGIPSMPEADAHVINPIVFIQKY